MTLSKYQQNFALISVALLLLLPFIGPYRYYNAEDFLNEMLTASCLVLLLISTVIYCKKIIIPHYLIPLLVAGLVLVLTTFFNSTFTQERLNFSIWLIGAGVVTVCIASIKQQYADARVFESKLTDCLFFSVFLMAVYSFLNFYMATTLAELTHIQVLYTGYLRMDGLLGQPNLLGIILFLGVCSGYYILEDRVKSSISYYLYPLMLLLISYCLFATLSRVALIALVCFLLYVGIVSVANKKFNSKLLIFLATIFLAYLAYEMLHPQLLGYAIKQQWLPIALDNNTSFESVDYSRATNLDHKIGEIKRALHIFIQHPIVGVGFGRYSYYSQQLTLADWPVYIIGFPYHSHNIISQVLAEFGAVGGLALFATIVVLTKRLIQSYASKFHFMLFGLLVVFGLNAIFEFALWSFNFAILFFALLAVYSNDKALNFDFLKTPLLKITYGIFLASLVLILASRWAIIDTLNKIYAAPENAVYAQLMIEDSLMGLNFSSIYLSGIKLSGPKDKSYAEEVAKVEHWRLSDMIYYRKVQLNIGDEDSTAIVANMQKALKLGVTIEMLNKLMRADCKPDNQACKIGKAYIGTLKR
jgi:O-antigen ligase